MMKWLCFLLTCLLSENCFLYSWGRSFPDKWWLKSRTYLMLQLSLNKTKQTPCTFEGFRKANFEKSDLQFWETRFFWNQQKNHLIRFYNNYILSLGVFSICIHNFSRVKEICWLNKFQGWVSQLNLTCLQTYDQRRSSPSLSVPRKHMWDATLKHDTHTYRNSDIHVCINIFMCICLCLVPWSLWWCDSRGPWAAPPGSRLGLFCPIHQNSEPTHWLPPLSPPGGQEWPGSKGKNNSWQLLCIMDKQEWANMHYKKTKKITFVRKIAASTTALICRSQPLLSSPTR